MKFLRDIIDQKTAKAERAAAAGPENHPDLDPEGLGSAFIFDPFEADEVEEIVNNGDSGSLGDNIFSSDGTSDGFPVDKADLESDADDKRLEALLQDAPALPKTDPTSDRATGHSSGEKAAEPADTGRLILEEKDRASLSKDVLRPAQAPGKDATESPETAAAPRRHPFPDLVSADPEVGPVSPSRDTAVPMTEKRPETGAGREQGVKKTDTSKPSDSKPQMSAPVRKPRSIEEQATPSNHTPEQAHRPTETDSEKAAIEVPPPAAGRNKARAGRAKTRLLGFNSSMTAAENPFDKSKVPQSGQYTEFPVGWLVIVKGPGRGAAFTLFNGVTQIGRGEGQTVKLDFGDNSISRENHAAIAYDPEQNSFFIGHGGKANLVRCNNMPVLATQALSAGDLIRVGETTLLFSPLCGPNFQWHVPENSERTHAAQG
ncbi:FHA domain-containing protein [Marimonas lutisalis]|uniref:FHA domain-containing protein n=1 Tax=Marimonas lutisalis TaxID=2545756 RepID=UPI001F38803C|nr:FHA domain-containing protein [Marimonas lutisalis]